MSNHALQLARERTREVRLLREENARLRADAERYRFLRRDIPSTLAVMYAGDSMPCDDDFLDEVIDKARAIGSGGTGA